MTKRTDLKIRLALKTAVLILLGVLVTPAAYDLLSIAVQVTYQFFWTTVLSLGGGYLTRKLITSILKDYKKVCRKRGRKSKNTR